MQLYSFGFNAFQQSISCSCKRILFSSWETTIILDDNDTIQVLGFQPEWISSFYELAKDRNITSVFGDPNHFLGILDDNGNALCTHDRLSPQSHVDSIVYSINTLYILHQDGSLFADDILQPHKAKKVCGSDTHILLLTSDPYAPLYALGSNKFSQGGIDFHQHELTEWTLIDYFSGLGQVTDMSCSNFHSAVIAEGDVYTFGWRKEGRLGRTDNDVISCAVFMQDGSEVDVNAIQVSCGSNHTLVLDDQGRVWSCGSSK